MTRRRAFSARQAGASYVEVLIAAVLIALLLLPLMETMVGAEQGTSSQQEIAVQHFLVTGRLEEVLAEPYAALESAAAAAGSEATPTSYSDPPGTNNRRLIYLSLYDADNADADNDPFTGVDAGLVWVRVELEATALALESLSAQ